MPPVGRAAPEGAQGRLGVAGYRRAKNRRLRDSRHKRDLDRVPSAAAPRVEVHLPGSPSPGVDQLIEITLHNRDPLPVGHTGRLRSSDFAAGEGTRVTAELRATRRLHHDAPVQDHAKCRGIASAGGWLRQAISTHLFNLTLVAAVVELSRLGQDAVLTGAVHLALDHEWERGSTSGGDTRPAPEVADLGLAVAAVTTECAQRRSFPVLAHRVTVLGSTWKSAATSAGVNRASVSTSRRVIGPPSDERSETSILGHLSKKWKSS